MGDERFGKSSSASGFYRRVWGASGLWVFGSLPGAYHRGALRGRRREPDSGASGIVIALTTRTMSEAKPSRCACVLVVEDDRDIRESLKLILENEGYGVITAENGQAALE